MPNPTIINLRAITYTPLFTTHKSPPPPTHQEKKSCMKPCLSCQTGLSGPLTCTSTLAVYIYTGRYCSQVQSMAQQVAIVLTSMYRAYMYIHTGPAGSQAYVHVQSTYSTHVQLVTSLRLIACMSTAHRCLLRTKLPVLYVPAHSNSTHSQGAPLLWGEAGWSGIPPCPTVPHCRTRAGRCGFHPPTGGHPPLLLLPPLSWLLVSAVLSSSAVEDRENKPDIEAPMKV